MIRVANDPGGFSALTWYCQARWYTASTTYSLSGKRLKFCCWIIGATSGITLTNCRAFGGGVCEIGKGERSCGERTRGSPTHARGLPRRRMNPTLDF